MKVETALAVLQSRTVRYSSPLSFNDPFDIQAGLHFEFDINSLHDKVLDRIEALASGAKEPSVDTENVWGKIVLSAREHFGTHGFPRARWKEMTKNLFGELTQLIQETQREFQRHWESMLPRIRVFSVTEEKDNLLMWAHYAVDHTGATFEFWSLPDEDNTLSVARRVEYVETPPPFFTETQWVNFLTGLGEVEGDALFRRYAYIKSHHWSYEREWRVWYPYSNSSEKFDVVNIRPSEFKAIYLGCRMHPSQKEKILHLVKANFPDAQVFQAYKNEGTYSLRFEKIK